MAVESPWVRNSLLSQIYTYKKSELMCAQYVMRIYLFIYLKFILRRFFSN
jgi:hypothetical protein